MNTLTAHYYKAITAAALILISASPLAAQTSVPDSVAVVESTAQFRQSWARFHHDADTTREAVEAFVAQFRQAGGLDTVVITSSASPEGTPRWLTPLARERGEYLRSLLLDAGIPASQIKMGTLDVDWPMLQGFVAADAAVPGQQEVLDIFHRYLPQGTPALKPRLRRAAHSQAWPYMYRKYFPAMRYARASFAKPLPLPPPPEPKPQPEPEPLPEPVIVEEAQTVAVIEVKPCTPRYWALKSNMLHDLVLIPNIGLEWAFLPQWSLAADYSGAWWGNAWRTLMALLRRQPRSEILLRPKST